MASPEIPPSIANGLPAFGLEVLSGNWLALGAPWFLLVRRTVVPKIVQYRSGEQDEQDLMMMPSS